MPGGRSHANPELAPGNHNGDTMNSLQNADPVLETCLRREHKCDRFITDQESALVSVPGDAWDPPQNTNECFSDANSADYTCYTRNTCSKFLPIGAATMSLLLLTSSVWFLKSVTLVMVWVGIEHNLDSTMQVKLPGA